MTSTQRATSSCRSARLRLSWLTSRASHSSSGQVGMGGPGVAAGAPDQQEDHFGRRRHTPAVHIAPRHRRDCRPPCGSNEARQQYASASVPRASCPDNIAADCATPAVLVLSNSNRITFRAMGRRGSRALYIICHQFPNTLPCVSTTSLLFLPFSRRAYSSRKSSKIGLSFRAVLLLFSSVNLPMLFPDLHCHYIKE